MTYNDIGEFFGLVPGAWRLSGQKKNGDVSPKYTAIMKSPDKWNLEWFSRTSGHFKHLYN